MFRGVLVEEGWTDHAIRGQVRAGAWVRVRHGAYVERRVWTGLTRAGQHELAARAVLQQGHVDLVLSHLSAMTLRDLDLWDIPLDDVHVTRPDARSGRHEAGVRQHRGVLLPGDVVDLHGLRTVSATRLALEATTVLDAEHALVIVNQLLHRKLTTHEQLRARYKSMESWPDTLLTDLIIRRSDGRPESVAESRFDHLCHTQALPRPEPQYKVRDTHGAVVARLDFALPRHRAYFEVDGGQKYDELVPEGMTPRQVIMAEKEREKVVYDLLPWLCIRVTWRDLGHPVRTADRISRQLAGRAAA